MNNQRNLDMFYLFSKCIPVVNSPELEKFKKSTGMDMSQLITDMIIGISADMVRPEHKENATNALIWIRDACNYILEESDTMPVTKQIKDGNNTRYTF